MVTNLSGRMNLWKVASSGGWPIQLSQSDEAQLDPTYSPDGKWVVYQQDKGLHARGGIVEAHYYPQESHGWHKREGHLDALRRTVEWFNRYLGTKAGTIAQPAN